MVFRVQPPELVRLPWEFMYDTHEDRYVCLEVPLVRQPQVARPMEPLSITPPLRILGMVALPDDQESLAAHAEQQRLHDALADLGRDDLGSLGWVSGQTWRETPVLYMRSLDGHIFDVSGVADGAHHVNCPVDGCPLHGNDRVVAGRSGTYRRLRSVSQAYSRIRVRLWSSICGTRRYRCHQQIPRVVHPRSAP
ncbi:hypothetical protein ACWDUC_07245 [Streptomyces tricolor]|nr:hypothetical protein EASAB2608_00396 [Streptomyces sp. EAS-AB2608]CUW32966.1 hypothetical protein TUE45_pSRTUE45c_0334 [Streptomyces reticuli]